MFYIFYTNVTKDEGKSGMGETVRVTGGFRRTKWKGKSEGGGGEQETHTHGRSLQKCFPNVSEVQSKLRDTGKGLYGFIGVRRREKREEKNGGGICE